MRCIVVFQCSPPCQGWRWTRWTHRRPRSSSPASCVARCFAAKPPWNATWPTNTPNDRRSTDVSSASGSTARETPWWPISIPIIRADPETLTLSSFEGLDKVGLQALLTQARFFHLQFFSSHSSQSRKLSNSG